MLKHNSYFDGQVQSIGFTRNGLIATVGAIAPGEYRFGTGDAERMSVISGICARVSPGASGRIVRRAPISRWRPTAASRSRRGVAPRPTSASSSANRRSGCGYGFSRTSTSDTARRNVGQSRTQNSFFFFLKKIRNVVFG